MNARSTRGPGGGRTGGRRPAARKGGGRSGGGSSGGGGNKGGLCLLMVAAALAVISTAVILTPLAARVWTRQMVPAADRMHFGGLLAPAMALAMFGLYLTVSVLLAAWSTRRRNRKSEAGHPAPVTR